jgi:hypothetical protein
VRRQAEDLLAREPDAAARRHQAGDGVAQRGLAHAVAPDDAEHAALQREAHSLQRMGAAVEDVERLDAQRRRGRAVRCVAFAVGAAKPGHQCRLPM